MSERLEKMKKDYELRYDRLFQKINAIDGIVNSSEGLKKYGCRSLAFKNLEIAVDLMREQVKDDHRRFSNVFDNQETKNEIMELQKSLNRERKKRESLEKQIKSASENSGLFISYVRKKLGI